MLAGGVAVYEVKIEDSSAYLGCRGSVADARGSLDPSIATEAGHVDVDGGRGGDRCCGGGRHIFAVGLDRLLCVAHITRSLLHCLSEHHTQDFEMTSLVQLCLQVPCQCCCNR